MLLLKVGQEEVYDEEKNLFILPLDNPYELKLEHSLLSISKWESIWKIPFLHTVDETTGKDTKTYEQNLSYIQCMSIASNVPPEVWDLLLPEHFSKVNAYINEKQTATWFAEMPRKPGDKQIVTSELIYYYMIACQIPVDKGEKWHLSRLLTLIEICNRKNDTKSGKMSKTERMARNRQINEERKARLNSKG